MPFIKGAAFQLFIIIKTEGYEVRICDNLCNISACILRKAKYMLKYKTNFNKFLQISFNGLRQYMFKHRFPLETVSKVEIIGDVSFPIFSFIDVSKVIFESDIFWEIDEMHLSVKLLR